VRLHVKTVTTFHAHPPSDAIPTSGPRKRSPQFPQNCVQDAAAGRNSFTTTGASTGQTMTTTTSTQPPANTPKSGDHSIPGSDKPTYGQRKGRNRARRTGRGWKQFQPRDKPCHQVSELAEQKAEDSGNIDPGGTDKEISQSQAPEGASVSPKKEADHLRPSDSHHTARDQGLCLVDQAVKCCRSNEDAQHARSFLSNGRAVLDPPIPPPPAPPTRASRRSPTARAAALETETREEVLKRLQESEMKMIGSRNRTRGAEPTTSLTDLELARRPLSPAQEMSTKSPLEGHQPHSNLKSTWSNSQVSAHGGTESAPPSQQPAGHIRPTSQSTHLTIDNKLDQGPEGDEFCTSQAQAPNGRHRRRSRWASAAEVRPAIVSVDSNAWGSPDPDDASTDSNDSVQPMHNGKLRPRQGVAVADSSLMGWDGKIQPPPVDWTDRPPFNNDTPEFKDGFDHWAKATVELVIPPSSGLPLKLIPGEQVRDVENHPDGITMVARDFTLNISNASDYGYCLDLKDATKYCQPITSEELGRVVRLDLSDPRNVGLENETTERLVQNWLAHKARQRAECAGHPEPVSAAAPVVDEGNTIPNPHQPAINIYLRPAVPADLPQITEIYNWYVENGPRTAEATPVSEVDMQLRFDNTISNKLPFIVAVEASKNRAAGFYEVGADLEFEDGTGAWTDHNTQKTSPKNRGLGRQDKIVGWACAQDFTAADYVERISVELEIYVEPESRRKGVGRCLMDQLLEACDRGYVKRGGYPFHCASEIAHLYGPGGGRDLHKLFFVVRLWQHPKSAVPQTRPRRGKTDTRFKEKMDDREDDWDVWLKAWLESCNFQMQGLLTGVGAKKGRL